MAIFFMKVNNVNKATQSAVAKAAYISGDRLNSERDGESKFYRREVNPTSFILKPDHAPDWTLDREKLWNEAEKAENRINSRIAREVILALPIEFTPEQHIELLREYVQENFVNKGMVADCNIHYDKEQNPHAHILLTVRPFDEKGRWSAKSKREYLFDENGENILDKNGKKAFRKIDLTEGWNDEKTLLEWRKNLAEITNQKLKKYGFNERVSHLSNQELGLSKVAKNRLTRGEYFAEMKAKKESEKHGIPYEPVTTFGRLNLEIEKYNQEIESIEKEITLLEKSKEQFEIKDVKLDAAILDLLKNIRKENSFKNIENLDKSYAFVAKRNKTEAEKINYGHVLNLEKSLKYWERKLFNDIRELNAEVEHLEMLREKFELGLNIKQYGIENVDFEKHYKQKYDELLNKKINLEGQRRELQEAKNSNKNVEKNEYKILYKQFTLIYPEHKNIVQYKTAENAKVMLDAMTNFASNKGKGVIDLYNKDRIGEKEIQILRRDISNVLENMKYISPAYFALIKQVKQIESDLENVTSISENENVYKLNSDLYKTKEHLKYFEGEYKENIEKVNDILKDVYGVDLSSLKVKDRIELLEHIIEKVEPKKLNEFVKDRPDIVQYLQNVSHEEASLFEGLFIAAVEGQEESNKNAYDKQNKKKHGKGRS